MRSPAILALLSFALASLAVPPAASPARAEADPCRTQTVHGNRYVICRIDMTKTAVLVRWRGNSGRPFGSLGAVEREVAANGQKLVFLMNGGMYHEDLSPVGYHVENREKFKNANTRPGPGNFHLLPNGIFFVDGKRAGVMETRAFLRRNKRPSSPPSRGRCWLSMAGCTQSFATTHNREKFETVSEFRATDAPPTLFCLTSQ